MREALRFIDTSPARPWSCAHSNAWGVGRRPYHMVRPVIFTAGGLCRVPRLCSTDPGAFPASAGAAGVEKRASEATRAWDAAALDVNPLVRGGRHADGEQARRGIHRH